MSNTNMNKETDKNKLYITVFSIIIIVVVIIVLLAKGCSTNKTSTGTNSSASTQKVTNVSVISEIGDQQSTIDADISIRDVDFSKKIKAIKKYEKKQSDTNNEPSLAESTDGYKYLSYSYNADNPSEFFGTKVSATDPTAMLVYVFYNDTLIEVRFQYGNIGQTGYNSIVSNVNSTYGNATYSRSYSNGMQESWWKTNEITLDVICQDSNVIAYYRLNR